MFRIAVPKCGTSMSSTNENANCIHRTFSSCFLLLLTQSQQCDLTCPASFEAQSRVTWVCFSLHHWLISVRVQSDHDQHSIEVCLTPLAGNMTNGDWMTRDLGCTETTCDPSTPDTLTRMVDDWFLFVDGFLMLSAESAAKAMGK